jgi:hypothetical protein
MAHSIADGACHGVVELRRVVGLTAILREQQIDYVLRTREAPDVGCENAVGA